MIKKIFISLVLLLFIILMWKLLFIGPESYSGLIEQKKTVDSLQLELIKLEMKRTLLHYKCTKLSVDLSYWEKFLRKSGKVRSGEASFIIRNDSIYLIYDLLENN